MAKRLLIVISMIMLAIGGVFAAPLASAQTPTPECQINPQIYLNDPVNGSISGDIFYGSNQAYLGVYYLQFSLPENVYMRFSDSSGYTPAGVDPFRIWNVDNWTPPSGSWSAANIPGTDNIMFGQFVTIQGATPGWSVKVEFSCDGNFDDPTPTPTAEPLPINTCTVTDESFNNPALWNLRGSAAVANSTLVLGAGDSASQGVLLKSNTTYKIEAEVSDLLDGPGSLRLSIGSAYSSIPISARYNYQTTIDTGAVSGPLEFKIFNDSTTGAVIYIDDVCLTVADAAARTCIAPENGDFQAGSFAGATGWNLYNGASHDTLNLRAILPYRESDLAMASTTSTYEMPELSAGEYLLLGFSASTDSTAWMGSQAGSSSLSYEVYPNNYDFEADISGQAGQSIDLTFANTGSDGFAATGTVYLDNVCVWVSPDPPKFPGPSDPGGIKPIDFGWKYGCQDAGAILAGLGINVFVLEDAYAAGGSPWEPSNWVPWLAAALWVNAGKPLICFLLTTFGWLVGMLEYFLNDFLNWADWGRRSWKSNSIWMGDSFFTVGEFLEGTSANWLTWGATSAINVWGSITGLNQSIVFDWFKAGLLWLLDSGISSLNQSRFGPTVDGATETIDKTTSVFGMLISWIIMHVVDFISVPLDFYNAFQAGINAPSYGSLFTCSGMDFWCTMLAGMQLMNRVSAHTVGYPVVIFGIIVGTIVIFWRWLWELITIRVS